MPLDRRQFFRLLGVAALLPLSLSLQAQPREVPVEILHIDKPDAGVPNNRLPLLIYHRVIPPQVANNAEYLEQLFKSNGWPPQWRYQAYPFTHFHANTHEVVGVFSGSARLQLGGEHGKVVEVNVGDVLLIPAGVGHKQLSADQDFMLVGAYPPNIAADLCHDEPKKMAGRVKLITAVPLPQTDPVTGHSEGSMLYWHGKN
jgi:uncharacterized protein YjlB